MSHKPLSDFNSGAEIFDHKCFPTAQRIGIAESGTCSFLRITLASMLVIYKFITIYTEALKKYTPSN